MAIPNVIIVDSIASFAATVEDSLAASLARQGAAPYLGNWYRGVGRAITHSLKPSLYRHPKKTSIEELIILERKMLEDFQRQNVLHGNALHSAGERDDFRMLFFMQHYGVPTRLLDWTGNPFIAFYFALTSAERDPSTGDFIEDAAVWVLDPVSWNSHALLDVSYGMEGPLSLDAEEVKAYGPRKLLKGTLEKSAIKTLYEHPVTILGVSDNARMFAQRGVFTIFGKVLSPMEEQYDTNSFPADCLVKIVVPKGKIADLTTRLLQIGYTDSVSYPDLHGLAMEIKRSRGFRV
jgi:hypothetical protein